MSSRTALTVVDQGNLPELGPGTTTEENSDVSNGNKVLAQRGTIVIARETTGVSKTVTYTYDERGQTRTLAVTLAANALTVLGPFDPGLQAHAADAAENGQFVWLSASGTAGQVKFRAINLRALVG